LFSTRFPAPQALCESIIAVIPASSVYYSLFCEAVLKIARHKLFVKDFFIGRLQIPAEWKELPRFFLVFLPLPRYTEFYIEKQKT
jgi:hypothetical protein